VIWYRHWLEMRAAVMASVLTAIIGSFLQVRGLLGESGATLAARADRSLFSALTGSFDTPQINLIAFHEEFTWYAILLLSYILSGDGLKAISHWTGLGLPGATQFTLSLPVSRRRVVITRIISTYTVGAVALFAIAATNAAAFSTTPHAVPLVPLLRASAFASLLVLFWSSMFVMLTVILGKGWGTAMTAIAMIVSTPAGMYGMSASATGQLEVGLLLLFGVVLGFVLAGTIAAAVSEEI